MKKSTNKMVEANLLYLANKDTSATYMASEAGGDIPEHLGEYQRHRITIQNARPMKAQLSLDVEGFRLVSSISQVTDFYDDIQVSEIYEAEVTSLIAQAITDLGESACHIEIFDHTRRTSSDSMRKRLKVREPAAIIHNDYTDGSALRTRENFFEKNVNTADRLNKKRFLIINLWRSIKGVIEQAPMTLCSANSIETDDIVSVERVAKNHRGELQLAVWNRNHRWYYFPRMDMEESLIFKTFDSATDGRARYTIHTAFDDPTSRADATARQSIETRCLVFLD